MIFDLSTVHMLLLVQHHLQTRRFSIHQEQPHCYTHCIQTVCLFVRLFAGLSVSLTIVAVGVILPLV